MGESVTGTMAAMFITLEGIEGSGKTTQIGYLADYLKKNGQPCVTTREPGGTEIGKKIRSILLDAANRALDPRTELLLYMADRSQHLHEVVLPALRSGKTVVCDRFFDATVVYQGYARGLGLEWVKTLHRIILNDIRPDLTLLLDLPPETGLSRAWKAVHAGDRTTSETRFEEEELSFHRRVREGYLSLSTAESGRFSVIDASQPPDQVFRDILKVLSR
jgi:dTMP kinase